MRNAAIAALICLPALAGPACAQDAFEAVALDAQTALDTARFRQASHGFERAAAISPRRAGEISPDWAWTYVQMGHFDLMARDYDGAQRCFVRAAEIHPPVVPLIADMWALTRINAFWKAFAQATEHERSADWGALALEAERTLRLVPGLPSAHYALGMAYEWGGHREKAKKQYITAIGRAPRSDFSADNLRKAAHAVTKNSGLTYRRSPHPYFKPSDQGGFHVYKSEHFTIYHHNAVLARRMARALEYYYTIPVLAGLLEAGGRFPDNCDVYVYRNKDEYLAQNPRYSWAGGHAHTVTRNRKVVTAEIHVFQGVPSLLESTIPHELAHVRFHSDRRHHSKVPLWLEEGVAVSAEPPYAKRNRWNTIRTARDEGSLIRVRDLFYMEEFPENVPHSLVYAEGFAMVDALVGRYGTESFFRLVRQIKLKEPVKALEEVYSMTPIDLENLVLEWIAAHEPRSPVPSVVY